MAFAVNDFQRTKPYLYHLTAKVNAARVRNTAMLSCTECLMKEFGRMEFLRQKRNAHEVLKLDGDVVELRDQIPLHEANARLPEGWSFADLVQSLNQRVFFWPGNASGPIIHGHRHFKRYRNEHPAIIRIGFAALLDTNPEVEPLFCKYNSGSPRCSRGLASPRGPTTFVQAGVAPFVASAVVEVTFIGQIRLPLDAELGFAPGGPWQPFFEGVDKSCRE